MTWFVGGSSSGVVGQKLRTDSIGAVLCSHSVCEAKHVAGVASEVCKADGGWYLLRDVRFLIVVFLIFLCSLFPLFLSRCSM